MKIRCPKCGRFETREKTPITQLCGFCDFPFMRIYYRIWSQILNKGMTREQVIQICGYPQKIDEGKLNKTLHFDYPGGGRIYFDKNYALETFDPPVGNDIKYYEKIIQTHHLTEKEISTINIDKEIQKHIEYFSNGEIKSIGTYKNGIKEGKWVEWYDYNGEIGFLRKKEGTYKDGEKSGLWTYWNEDGKKREEGSYKDGEFDGEWIEWWKNGRKYSEKIYIKGKRVSIYVWDEDGVFIC